MAGYTVEDMRKRLIARSFPGWQDCGCIRTVIYNGVFFTMSFIKKGEKFLVVNSMKDHGETCIDSKEVTREEGNALWKAVKATEFKGRNNKIFYDFGKAYDALPLNIKNKFNF